MSIARRASKIFVLAALLCGGSHAVAADRYDPRLRFRTLRTEHFDIHAHQGEEAMARRLAGIAERVRQRFQPVFGVPRGRVQVVLVDQTDLSNGWARPVPYDEIEITAVPPSAESLIGNTTDWLELVFTHEYTHILHLDRTRGFMRGIRGVFGRVPLAFPNSFLPVWQVEGIATFEESRMTGEGRIPAGDFRAIVDVAAANRRFEPVDRASGGLVDWPSGNAPYAYGAYFHQFLADRYGAERLATLADATAGRVPLFGAGAFKKLFGRSESELWKDFRESREGTSVPRSDTDAKAQRLTQHGFVVTAPRVTETGAIYYAISNADGFPALMTLPPGGVPRRVAWRALGNRTSVRGDWIVFDQVERVRSIALYSDLYAVKTDGGGVRRLTKDARAADPDLSPDGRRIVCTVQATGRRALALLDFNPDGVSAPRMLIDEAGADFTGPRWSPDGRQIVVERRRQDAYDLVLIDPETRTVRTLVTRNDARLVTPSWTPDGATVLFSADLSAATSSNVDAPFNVFSVDVPGSSAAALTNAEALVNVGEIRQLTDTVGGAQFPELSSNGTLTYVGYTTDGNDLFSVPVDPSFRDLSPRLQPDDQSFRLKAEATKAEATKADATNGTPAPVSSDAGGFRLQPEDPAIGDHPYRPWRTLRPTFWTPIIETDAGETVIGAATGMVDALGRHYYAADAGWGGGRARPDWHASYAYDRWRPTLLGSYADDTDPIRGGTIRSRELFAGAQLPFRRLRRTETLQVGFDAQTDTVSCTSTAACREAHRDLRSVRAGWLHDSRRLFGYSISTEEGFAIEAAAESSGAALGSDVGAAAAVFDARVFHRVFSRHTVIAARAAIATGWGDADARVFSAGGSGPSYSVFDFGRDTIGLLRGFAPEDVVGPRAAVANLDLRVPLAYPQRGYGSWPVFFRAIHAAAFVDAGSVWDTTFRTADIRTSTGGELSLDLVVFHYVPITFVGGAAWTRDPVADRSRAAVFGRVGYAF
jgi:Tol biopolymer transport system component